LIFEYEMLLLRVVNTKKTEYRSKYISLNVVYITGFYEKCFVNLNDAFFCNVIVTKLVTVKWVVRIGTTLRVFVNDLPCS
jgi:hypothetical protein